MTTLISPTSALAVIGKSKGKNQVYEIFATTKEIKKDSFKSAQWIEQWTLETGTDENMQSLNTIKGTLKVVAYSNEEGSAELNISRKLQPTKISGAAADAKEICNQLVKVIQTEQQELINGIEMNREVIKSVIEEKVRRKCGKTGNEYKGERILKNQ